jgi:predicted HTH transcriptional regulator
LKFNESSKKNKFFDVDLQFFLRQKEGERLDFKQTAKNKHKIAKTLCAFANTKGGKLVIGISDRGYITGIDPDEEIYMVQMAGVELCRPELEMNFEVLEDYPEFEGAEPKMVLIVDVKESNYKPVRYLDKAGEWQTYVRVGDQSLPAAKTLTKRLEKGINGPESSSDFQPDKHQQRLLQHLKEKGKITVPEFCKLANLSKRRATKLITDLLLEGMLREHTLESKTFYTL